MVVCVEEDKSEVLPGSEISWVVYHFLAAEGVGLTAIDEMDGAPCPGVPFLYHDLAPQSRLQAIQGVGQVVLAGCYGYADMSAQTKGRSRH